MDIQSGDELEKNTSADRKGITFKKKEEVSSETKEMIDQLFTENQELMERLKDKWFKKLKNCNYKVKKIIMYQK